MRLRLQVAAPPHIYFMKTEKAVVLFSGGLDSTTALCWALERGYVCTAVSFDYGQRHKKENASARRIASAMGVKLHGIKLALPWLAASSLVDPAKKIPAAAPGRPVAKTGIPSTFVPGRNLMFASIGVSLADSIGASAVVMGPNVVDYSGYPDCRPEFYRALEKAVSAGTRRGAAGKKIKLLTPLIRLSKREIILLGLRLRAPLELTWSCYAGGALPCGRCDSCRLRAKGFKEAGIPDPAMRRLERRAVGRKP